MKTPMGPGSTAIPSDLDGSLIDTTYRHTMVRPIALCRRGRGVPTSAGGPAVNPFTDPLPIGLATCASSWPR
jgi:hypothetical protein